MNENNVSLSQDEVDKLLGITTLPQQNQEEKLLKKYKVKEIISERESEVVKRMCDSITVTFKKNLKENLGEPATRTIKVSSVKPMNINQFFDTATNNDFLYKIKIDENICFVKLDNFLFGALSGLAIDPKSKINKFQCAALKHYVISPLVECLIKANELPGNADSVSLYEADTTEYCTDETGLCIAINWNENLKSFGMERIFLSENLLNTILKK